ncbi:hypothetical protein Tco_0892454 [Tanacetum coccineum]|uniref:Transposase (Putative), gypsy type n=1 Tax=Tanacetum coccineum TaxID=301880 RepID=A0ABQ5C8P9_9ASTR
MGKGTIEHEDAISTIFGEYLLEFTLEYGIREDLHPELPGSEETIIDFLEGKVGVYTKFFEFANYRIPLSQFLFDVLGYYQIHLSQLSVTGAAKDKIPLGDTYSALDVVMLDTRRTPIQKQPELLLCLVGLSRRYFLGDDMYPIFLHDDDWGSALNPVKVKTGTRARAAYEVPLLTATATCVIDIEEYRLGDLPGGNPPTSEVAPTLVCPDASTMGSLVRKRRHERRSDGANVNALLKVLRKDHVSSAPNTIVYPGGKILTSYGVSGGAPFRSYLLMRESSEIPIGNVATAKMQNLQYAGSSESGKSTSVSSMVGSPEEVRLLKKARAQIARRDQRNQVREDKIKRLNQEFQSLWTVEEEVHGLHNRTKNLDTLTEAEVDMKRVAVAKNTKLIEELESLCAQFSDLQVNNNQMSQQVSNFQAHVKGEEKIKAAFEDFKKYEDDKVE